MIVLPSFDDLRDYVHATLCRQANLTLQTPLHEAKIYRRGQPCGLEYTLIGPRSTRLSSIWEALRGRILFYDEKMSRFLTQDVNGPQLDSLLLHDMATVKMESFWRGK